MTHGVIHLENDYSEGAHPAILARLADENLRARSGYGADDACESAAARIRGAIGRDDADVHFLIGGTSANLIALAAFLRPHEAIVCTEQAHINVHETGAIEASGHKSLPFPTTDGKLTPSMIEQLYAKHVDEHMVKPRVAYISNATELGTVYTRGELYALKDCCAKLNLLLYMDGARLGAALAASDVDWSDLPRCLDAFYIGGTKNGALFGEAMVILNESLKPDFRYLIKQRGGMLAKGFLLGYQFDVLFEGGLYLDIARRANGIADGLRGVLAAKGARFLADTRTNMLFPILPDAWIAKLRERFAFHDAERVSSTESAVRLVTSWATPESVVTEFERCVNQLR
ncbi:MAG: aminotransferase class I/II-fold pyridoxal phosphate-dependent enzyme [Oscillospiraceae bacterium]|jgi:threonine aldolase|nr:aminotransferase class I/II-fold pyridoxal phosphate-dependent enzyme [Oscillospiraceae bacterium]